MSPRDEQATRPTSDHPVIVGVGLVGAIAGVIALVLEVLDQVGIV